MNQVPVENLDELLAAKDPAYPQAVVAGWFLPSGMPCSAAFVHASAVPTEGQMLVAWASCLAACLRKIDEITREDPAKAEALLKLVDMTVGSLEVVARLKNTWFREAGAIAATS